MYLHTYEYRHVCMHCNWNTQLIHLCGSYNSGVIHIASPLACFSNMYAGSFLKLILTFYRFFTFGLEKTVTTTS